MKIITRAELMQMPDYTVFSYYERSYMRGLYIMSDKMEHDFVCMSLIDSFSGDFEDGIKKMEDGMDVPFDNEYFGREGYFDDDQLYVVYSQNDLDGIVGLLNKARGV